MHFNGPYKSAELIAIFETQVKKITILEASIAFEGNTYIIIHYVDGDRKTPDNKRTLFLNSNTFNGFEGKGYAKNGDRF